MTRDVFSDSDLFVCFAEIARILPLKFKILWNDWAIFLAIKRSIILKIKVSPLQRALEICCTIFFRRFIEFWTLGLNDKDLKSSDIYFLVYLHL